MAKIRKPRGARELIVDQDGKLQVSGEVVVESGGEILVKNGGVIRAEPGGVIANNLEESTPKKGAAASLTTAIGVADAELVYTAKTRGAAGNNITIEYEDPEEANAAVVIEVAGTAIKAVLAPGGGEAITTTAGDISAAIAIDEEASALVGVANKAGNDGSGVVTAMAATPLKGGVDATPARKGDICFDATNIYIATDDVDITDDGTGWRKIAHGAL